MRKERFVVANFKMYPKTAGEAVSLARRAARRAARTRGVRTVICPPGLYIIPVAKALAGRKCAVGTQDVSLKSKVGPYTGEVSAELLHAAGVRYAIVGHSERRELGETDNMISRKLLNALDAGLSPILCVGERERDAGGEYLSWLANQVREPLGTLGSARARRLIIAYEPIWAIGKTSAAALAASDVHQIVLFIRKTLSSLYSRKVAESIPVLYGGSVEPENAGALASESTADGFLVGHASLDAEAFGTIIDSVGK